MDCRKSELEQVLIYHYDKFNLYCENRKLFRKRARIKTDHEANDLCDEDSPLLLEGHGKHGSVGDRNIKCSIAFVKMICRNISEVKKGAKIFSEPLINSDVRPQHELLEPCRRQNQP